MPAHANSQNLRIGEWTITHVSGLPERRAFELGGEPASLGWLHREYSLLDMPFYVFEDRGWVLYRNDGTRREFVTVPAALIPRIEAATGLSLSAGQPLGLLQRWGGLVALGFAVLLVTVGNRPARPSRPMRPATA